VKRFAVPLVIVGSLAVLAALVIMLRSITSTAPLAPVTVAPPPKASPGATTAPAPTPTPRPGMVTPVPQARPRSEDRPPALPSIGGDMAPTLGSDAPPGTKLNTKNLHFGLPQLREKIAANAPHVTACLGGSKPTGEATLTFIVAQKAGKIIVEQTDVDRDKTTLQDEALLECLHKTAQKIQLDGLPREAEAIIVTRVLTLQDGAITEDKPTKFSYLR